MSIDFTSLRAALQPGPTSTDRLSPPSATAKPEAPVFAEVLEIETARANREARRAGEIPAAVWEEVEAANRLFDELHADGHRVVFDDGRLNGRLVISLCDLEGRVLRSVDPGEILGPRSLAVDNERRHGGAA